MLTSVYDIPLVVFVLDVVGDNVLDAPVGVGGVPFLTEVPLGEIPLVPGTSLEKVPVVSGFPTPA